MRRWWMRRAAPALVLLALLSDGNAASAIRRSSSFVVPTSGSSHTLTLTTYVTDAADLHYAAVLSGHAPLEAAEIKSASQRCLEAAVDTMDDSQAAKDGGVVQASTVAVDRAQKVERQLVGLRANTSYDVYFVAEVPNSKGVYGAVLSVLGTTTHPTPPELKAVVAAPVNGSAKAVAVNVSLSTPGIVHVALVPARDSPSRLTVKNVVDRARDDAAFALESLIRWDSLSTQLVVDFLSPATEYELVVVTEALGNGAVYSELQSQPHVRTHAPAPDISTLTCEATKGSASSMDITFNLRFPEEDVSRASDETVSFFQYQLHYEVEALTPSTEPSGPDIDRGTFSIGKFGTVADLARQADAGADHKRIIEGLDPATSHTIRLYAETKESNGVVGRTREISSCVTHATAPKVLNATAQPTNGTVHALDILVELERPGNVHYVLTPRSSMQSLRNSYQRASSVDELVKMVSNDNKDASGFHSGVIETNEAAVASFVIDGLVDNTAYTIALLPETIASFGVFGEPYQSLLDASTNENASEVVIVDMQPSFGSLTSADLQLSMAKPLDFLFICVNAVGATEQCDEVPRTELQQLSQSSEATNFSFTMANLTEDTEYQISLFAESRLRNGVVSDRTTVARVKTHRPAPEIVKVEAEAVPARVDAISYHLELSEPGRIHYVVVMEVEEEKPEQPEEEGTPTDQAKSEEPIEVEPLAAELIIEQSRRAAPEREVPRDDRRDHRDRHSHHRHRDDRNRQPVPPSTKTTSSELRIVKRGQAFASSSSLELLVEGLTANTTYSIHVVSETRLLDGVSSGVYGSPSRTTVTTHDVAPVIVKSMAGATCNCTNSIVLTVNLTRPGVVHYQLTDVEFADPSIIKNGLDTPRRPSPHVLRGSFVVQFSDMGMEIKNGTNDTQPMNPMVFATNLTIDGLREDTTYHVSLTTETFDSGGVFGDFPAPLLVTTHAQPPQFVADSLRVGPMAGSSSSLSMDFRLTTLGEVHYALFFRGLVSDRTTEIYGIEEQKRHDDELHARELRMLNSSYNASEEPPLTPRWPPVANVFDVTQLTPRQLKDAEFEQLGEGVWENDTISVSREDVFHKKLTHKKIEKLPPSAMFDVCLVPETAASDGVFAPVECHRVTTHADYTNQSVMFDEVEIFPVEGTTGGVNIKLQISKLLDAPEDTSVTVSDNQRLELATGRIPYFILLDGRDARPELSHNTFQSPSASRRYDKNVSPFKLAVAGRSHVVAAGVLATVTSENATFVTVEHTVRNLQANTEYYFFFAYETAGSDGLFTEVNPHKNRPNETETTNSRHSSKPETSAIRVTTHERAPQLKAHEATATYGNTSRLTVSMDLSCITCEETVVHLLVANEGCPLPSTDQLLPSAGDVATAQALGKIENEPCMLPLIYKRVDVNMTEESNNGGSGGRHRHHHHRHHGDGRSRAIDIDVEDDLLLEPNTTYQVWIATETAHSGGVISESFYSSYVKTFPRAPRFTQLVVQPRKGSTTDLLLIVTLEHPGEVHYMLGKSGNDELNVTSPFNVSGKALPGDRDAKFHNYGRDVVRSRRSITIARAGEVHVEVIEYLVAGTSYDVFVVAETADDSGIYGEVMSFPSVSTFATPPMLLAHTAYPTPGTVDSLSVGFRVEDSIASVVHVSVITSVPWAATARVAEGSDTFGNRLAMEDRFIGRQTIEIDGGKPVNGDDGWKEVNISVPTPGTNYTVFLVTETKDSDGVYGTVATHYNVQSHPEPPLALNVSVRPTDARVDALTVDVTLSHDQGGHIHYAVLRHRQRFTRSSIANLGKIDVNGSNTTIFVVEGLKGRTAYDVYLRMESFESHGVIGDWSPFPVTATTHGLPAEVLESIECEVTPSCQSLGRHACSQVANVCGECLDGYDGITGSSNAACRRLEPGEVTPTIKISGVRINPRHRRFYPSGPVKETSDEPTAEATETSLFAADPEPAVESQTSEVDTNAASIVDVEDGSVCPGNAQFVGPGKCECEPGYQVDTMGTTCVPFYQNTNAMAMGYTSRAL